jgi:hypothetical protein
LADGRAPHPERLRIRVEAAAAVAEQRTARRHGQQVAERVDAILQGHRWTLYL